MSVPSLLDPWRCPRCNRLLARVNLAAGSTVEIVCERCGAVVVKQVEDKPEQSESCRLVALAVG